MNKLLGIALSLFIVSSFSSGPQTSGFQIGETVPEIALPNPQGDTLRLSQLRGKLVVIDFWASWCRACRLHNQRYKSLYNRYVDSSFVSGTGLALFSVSLDTDRQQWKDAIANDRLPWPYQVSDLLGWNSPLVKQHGFRDLPYNLIVDGQGQVLAKNIHQSKLNQFIEAQLAP